MRIENLNKLGRMCGNFPLCDDYFSIALPYPIQSRDNFTANAKYSEKMYNFAVNNKAREYGTNLRNNHHSQ